MTKTAVDEMRERIQALRNKAELNRRDARTCEDDAQRAHEFAASCDRMADQYEAVLSQVKPERFDVLAEF